MKRKLSTRDKMSTGDIAKKMFKKLKRLSTTIEGSEAKRNKTAVTKRRLETDSFNMADTKNVFLN